MSDAEDEAKTQTCADCSAGSPPIATNYTLIGTHGWRLTRRTTTNGDFVAEWRCPTCWLAFKRASQPSEQPKPTVDESERALARSLAPTVRTRRRSDR